MMAREMRLRLVEWRAERLADPAERLRYLQRAAAPRVCVRKDRRRALGLALLVAPGLAAGSVALAQPDWRRIVECALVDVLLPAPRPLEKVVAAPRVDSVPAGVWPVDVCREFEVYSNGLRVENQFLAASQPRAYLAFARARGEGLARAGREGSRPAQSKPSAEWRVEPAGIVYHTTESHLAPFREDQNRKLKRAGESMLEYVRRKRSYHFVIDRFGRVFRIVRESDYSNHAGRSVWADERWVYLNLNQSFFGIAFEAQSRGADEGIPVNPAQVHAGRVLTEMLRVRYGIAAENCVTHAQVSVNAGARRAGYHTDWAAHLPFAELGLGENYERALPSLTLFGFDYDASLAEAGGAPLRKGLELAEAEVGRQAAASGMSVVRYRKALQKRYRDATAALRAKGVVGENY